MQESNDNPANCEEPPSNESLSDGGVSTAAASVEETVSMPTETGKAKTDWSAFLDRALAVCAVPRKSLSSRQRKMLDVAAITLACWVPIAWGFAISSPRSGNAISLEDVPKVENADNPAEAMNSVDANAVANETAGTTQPD